MPSKSIALPRNGGEKGPAKGKRERQIAAIRRLRACREFIPVRETSLQKTSTSSSNLAAAPSLWPFSTSPDVSGDCAAPIYAFFPSSNALVVISRPVIPTVEDRVSPAPRTGVLERACRLVTTPGPRAIHVRRTTIRSRLDLSMAWSRHCLVRALPRYAALSAPTGRTPVV